MRYEGQEPFQRPMRPDRVEMIRQTVQAVALDEVGKNLAKKSESFADYQSCIAWTVYGALADHWPDTMIAELQAGLADAEKVCRSEFERCQRPFSNGK
ncbi:hypothetical protein [Sulfitobacter sp. 1A12056]|uniref:hypothetical protein n=1 Tax=Sulfitobacter sp. 1A12056 TaxID=3368592 RepID=UPI003745502B